MGPSSPGGPLGPGGPAAPAGPDSPFSPRSPLGPWNNTQYFSNSESEMLVANKGKRKVYGLIVLKVFVDNIVHTVYIL